MYFLLKDVFLSSQPGEYYCLYHDVLTDKNKNIFLNIESLACVKKLCKSICIIHLTDNHERKSFRCTKKGHILVANDYHNTLVGVVLCEYSKKEKNYEKIKVWIVLLTVLIHGMNEYKFVEQYYSQENQLILH